MLVVHPADLTATWDAYKRNADRTARDALILAYAPLAGVVAARIAAGVKNVDIDDLRQYGMIGVIDAIDRYDPARGVKFETYATRRIRGAILDALRSVDWAPRALRPAARQIDAARSGLSHRLHRHPTESELAGELGWDVRRLRETIRRVDDARFAALDAALPDDETTLGDVIADRVPVASDFTVDDMRRVMATAVNGMPERVRTVLNLYYVEKLAFPDIGRVLGVTESRICQIHTKAILEIRSSMVEPLAC